MTTQAHTLKSHMPARLISPLFTLLACLLLSGGAMAQSEPQVFDDPGFDNDSFESGDLSRLPWQNIGDRDWFVDSVAAVDGSFAVRTPDDLGGSDRAELILTVTTGNGQITYTREDQVGDQSTLQFFIDGVNQEIVTDGTARETVSFPVSAGVHTFSWLYTVNPIEGTGSNIRGSTSTAHIDLVSFPLPVYQTTENAVFTLAAPGVLANDFDADGDPLVIDKPPVISDGAAVVELLPTGGFSYDPRNSFQIQSLAEGTQVTDTFRYSLAGGSNEATVSVALTGVNDAPDAQDDSGAGFEVAADDILLTASVLDNDSDIDQNDVLSIATINTAATSGIVTDLGNGSFRYDPAGAFDNLLQGQSASDSFVYTVQDSLGATDTAVVTITVFGRGTPLSVPTLNRVGLLLMIVMIMLVSIIRIQNRKEHRPE